MQHEDLDGERGLHDDCTWNSSRCNQCPSQGICQNMIITRRSGGKRVTTADVADIPTEQEE